jgi:hypothetical protein
MISQLKIGLKPSMKISDFLSPADVMLDVRERDKTRLLRKRRISWD